MAWPTTKAGTTNVDQGSDKISLARPDIKQNIDNVNDIIDTFGITSPSDNDVLEYNSTSGKFENVSGVGSRGTVVLTLDALPENNNVDTAYDGTFTITGDNKIGLSTSTPDSAGRPVITFPAGTYIIENIYNRYSGLHGSAIIKDSIETNWRKDSDDSVLWTGLTSSLSLYFNVYHMGAVVTLASETNVYLTYAYYDNTGSDLTHPAIAITRIA